MSLWTNKESGGRRRNTDGFTIPELMLTLCVAVLVGGGLLSLQLFGQRMWNLTETKVNTADKARQIVRIISSDVRAAKLVKVGTGDLNSFTEASPGSAQRGNALQVHASSATNVFVRYFQDPGDQTLKYCTNDATAALTIAQSVSSNMVFSVEDFSGVVLSNHQQKSLVGIALSFSALDNPPATVGPGCYYKSYQLRAKVAQQTQ